MIAIIWFVNFAISWFNAWAVGTTWDGAKAKGGAAYFMNWMGAIMSASGFTWCYLVIAGFLGSITPMAWLVEAEEGAAPVTGYLLEAESLQAFADLGFLIIIFPILGSGLAITVQTWRVFARRRAAGEAGMGDYAITGWNTFAQVHNTYTAIKHIPGVLDRLGNFFGGSGSSSSSGDGKGKAGLIVIVLVVVSAIAGILTTYSIIQARRRAVILDAARRELMAS